MTSPNQCKTLSPFQFTPEEELRLSVKKGLEVHFFKSMSKFDSENLQEVINEKYVINDDQEMTLLIEATLNGHTKIVEYMLDKCKVDVDALGKVNHFSSIVDGATALWCAAGSGYLDIVKILIDKGATVDHCTKTKSTPLRAACYLGKEDIVQYLIEKGADVNRTNIFNSTCLMIASYKGHENVVNYLLKNGADVNKQTNCGATAMHFAAQANKIKVVKLLLEYNAQQTKNDQSLTPILVAAERTHYKLVKYLLKELNLTRKEHIEVEELLGASFLNDKDRYDINLGFDLLKHSMEMRFDGDPVIPKDVYEKVDAYNNQVECQNLEDLMKIKVNDSALHYESLIIRERILGVKNPDLLQSIIYRGAVYADSQNYSPCLKLWNHAMKIAQKNNLSIFKDLLRFTQVFCQMIKTNVKIVLSELISIMQVAIEEFKINKEKLTADLSADERELIEMEYFSNIFSTLGLIIIASNALEHTDNSNDPHKGDLMKIIVEINRLDLRTNIGQTLLHLCLDYDTNVDNIFTTGICCFPNYLTMKLLIYCGADVDAVDIDNNTPLHYIGRFIEDFPHIPHESGFLDTKKMVLELLNAGAHTDFVNYCGSCPHTGYLKTLFKLTNNTPRSLKCLSAIALKKNAPSEFYINQLPKTLELFTSLH